MAPIFCHARNRCEGWNPMQLSRRTFLRSVGLGTVAATSVQWPLPAWSPAAAFLGPGKQLIQASPTFESMDHYARSAGAEVISVPLTATFAHDLDAMLARTGTSSTLVYICNPNNPTASLTPRNDIESFIGK